MTSILIASLPFLSVVSSYPFGAPGCNLRPNHGEIVGNLMIELQFHHDVDEDGGYWEVS